MKIFKLSSWLQTQLISYPNWKEKVEDLLRFYQQYIFKSDSVALIPLKVVYFGLAEDLGNWSV